MSSKSKPEHGAPVSLPPPEPNLASLYIGNLAPSVNEEDLFNRFAKSGSVSEIRVCRDSSTGHSLGYGYINFHSPADAERALTHLNFSRINDREIRLMWSMRDKRLRQSGVGNIIIQNLDESIDNKTLFDTFSLFGPILSSFVAVDNENNSKGYGFVHYCEKEDAEKAMNNVNKKLIAGKTVKVMPFVPRSSRARSKSIYTNVYVKNFAPIVSNEQEFRDLLSGFGTITSVYLPTKSDGSAVGYGFANFNESESAEKAIAELHGKEIAGGKEGAESVHLYVARALTKKERRRQLMRSMENIRQEIDARTAGRNVFFKNLPDALTTEQLRETMKRYGEVESCKVETDSEGKSRCYGYVLFRTREAASSAIEELNDKKWGEKVLYVRLWQRKEKRLAEQRALSSQTRRSAQQVSYGSGMMMPQVFQPQMMYPFAGMQRMLAPASQAMGSLQQQQMVAAAMQQQQMASMQHSAEMAPRQPEYAENLGQDPEVGQMLYTRVVELDPENATKITGMLLELKSDEIREALTNDNIMRHHVTVARQMIAGSKL